MNVAIKVFTLAALIRVLIATDKPWLCAAIYTGVAFLINMAFRFGETILSVALTAGLIFIAASVYFWILDRLEPSSIVWWIIAVIGVPIVFF
jgi:hypothetical protein